MSIMKVFGCLCFVGTVFAALLTPSNGRIMHHEGFSGPIVSDIDRTGSPIQSWAYVTVRPKAHMFYWLYQTTHAAGYLNRPLILWLQGGPGGSGTGFGNFGELGPLDVDLKPRNTTWLQTASLLFVDNPVGTGFSYAEDPSAFTTNVAEISADLLTLMKSFLKNHAEFQKVPFYIFSESYGGKMNAAFSAVLADAIEAGDVRCDFKGFAMGDSWISPIDSVMSWGPFLQSASIVNQNGLNRINKGAQLCASLTQEGEFFKATSAWNELEGIVEEVGSNVDFYNINTFDSASDLKKKMSVNATSSPLDKLFARHVGVTLGDALSTLMNGPIKDKLKIIPSNVVWGKQAGMVFTKQAADFMKNVTSTVNNLVNAGKLKVIVYSGQLDLICNVLGTEAWFARLDISKPFSSVPKHKYSCGSHKPVCYFASELDNVQFYWILGAGHMVPADNAPGALAMVNQIINGK